MRVGIVGVSLLSGCAQIAAPLANVNFVAIEQEAELSARFAAEVESSSKLSTDAAVTGYVADLGAELVRGLRDPGFPYTFRVVRDDSVNAFNIGGGRVYVHTGLLAHAKTEGQVVSVLAHEIGHQVARHVAKQISRQQLFETVAQTAVGSNESAWLQMAAGLGITTGQLHFGRDAEREADAIMVDLMLSAGWDPREAIAMFELLRSIDSREPGAVAKLFSSHPPTSERIERVRARIEASSLASDLRRDSTRFQRIRDRIAKGA